jgi:hypothetical protein
MKNHNFLKFLLLLAFCAPLEEIFAGEALCKESQSGTPYCKYTGKIKNLYVNKNGLVLMFLESPIPIEDALKYGYKISSGNAISMEINSSNTFLTSTIYMSLLSAFEDDLNVEVHMRSVKQGYMELDRIWFNSKTFLNL